MLVVSLRDTKDAEHDTSLVSPGALIMHSSTTRQILLVVGEDSSDSSSRKKNAIARNWRESATRLYVFSLQNLRCGGVAIIIMMMASSPGCCLTRNFVPASAIAVSRLSSSAPRSCSSSFSCSSVSSSVISISTVFQLIRRKTSCSIVISGFSRRRRRNSVTRPGRPGFEASGVRRKTKVRAIVEERESDIAATATNRGGLQGNEDADIVVIGSGVGGLCCGSMLARYGEDVLVLESHDNPGGAAHSFEIKGYHFDSGPSLFSGLSSRGPQANPLAQVFDALGEAVDCVQYDSWMVHIPEGQFLSRIGATEFYKDLQHVAGSNAVADWRKLQEAVLPLSAAAMALPPAAIRTDWGALVTVLARYGPQLLKTFVQMGPHGAMRASKLLGPFSELVDSLGVQNSFVRNWIDLLSFLLSGLKADGTLAAEIVYMFGEWYKPGCVLEYPCGGTGAIVDALVRGLKKHGGRLALNTHVDSIVVEEGRAVGVKLRDGRFVQARKAVVSNASTWDTVSLLPPDAVPKELQTRAKDTPQCDSFMHLHLGIDAKDLPSDLEIHHIVVNNWSQGVDAPQNVVLISVPSVLDPSLAPAGKHVLHAYTPGSEPYSLWKDLDRQSAAYLQLKAERSEVLWRAVEKALGPGFSREKCEVKLVGTPLTHERFLRRNRGTYGPAIRAGKGLFPMPSTPVDGLFCCGDSVFPGIGIPAVAASGLVTANSLASVSQHSKLLDAIGV